MTVSIADQYFLKGLENFNYDWEQSIENLNYALSYDPEHAAAHHLMGKLFEEQFYDYKKAEECYVNALASNPTHLPTCKDFAYLYLKLGKYKEALNLIEYYNSLEGKDIGSCHYLKAYYYEFQRMYPEALLELESAIEVAVNDAFIEMAEENMTRIKEKLKKTKKLLYNSA